MTRASGILLHISSLPGEYGIGTFGRKAYDFVDFLEKAGQKYWQVLPMGPTDYGNSPYQSSSVFAGNPFFIDPELLVEEGLLKEKDCEGNWGENPEQVDFDRLIVQRPKLLHQAFSAFQPSDDYESFCEENRFWLEDYALYMALKEEYGCGWQKWPKELKQRQKEALDQAKIVYRDKIAFHQFLQYEFHSQWSRLKKYANEKNVKIIGDIPIYTAADSADTWAEPEQFQLDADGYPLAVAGVPPDAFSETGQLWGNPLYNWKNMKKDGYDWWLRRMAHNQKLYDTIRIDHFRGLESYYSVPYGAQTAENGHWEKGPGLAFFKKMEKKLGKLDVIAEDLGILTEEVHRLRKKSGFPGMKILQFAFSPEEESSYLPHNCEKNSVIYTGTHDNNTALGWFEDLRGEEQDFVCRYIHIKGREELSWGLVRAAWAAPSQLAVAQMQDFLDLPGTARMNRPGTLGNWQWRMKDGQLTDELAEKLRILTKTYFR